MLWMPDMWMSECSVHALHHVEPIKLHYAAIILQSWGPNLVLIKNIADIHAVSQHVTSPPPTKMCKPIVDLGEQH